MAVFLFSCELFLQVKEANGHDEMTNKVCENRQSAV